jgi:hypothetical protein
MTWRLKVQGVILALMVLAGLAFASATTWVEASAAPAQVTDSSDWASW